jgi:peptide/nickel transport system substrate-binding protein
VRVREAIGMLFDFEWTNKNIFFGLYRRTASYFEGSELSAHRVPADALERSLLAPFPGAVRAAFWTEPGRPPVSDGSGRDRAILRRALGLFAAAGYELRGTELVERKSGRPLTFEIMVTARNEAMDESAWRCSSPDN